MNTVKDLKQRSVYYNPHPNMELEECHKNSIVQNMNGYECVSGWIQKVDYKDGTYCVNHSWNKDALGNHIDFTPRKYHKRTDIYWEERGKSPYNQTDENDYPMHIRFDKEAVL